MLTGLESIGNTSTSLGTNLYRENKKIPARHMYALGTVFTA